MESHNDMERLLRSLAATQVDGKPFFVYCPPASDSVVAEFERVYRVKLPSDVAEFYGISNGGRVGAERIDSLEESIVNEYVMMSVHSWGNGDTDCVCCDDQSPDFGAICFCDHEQGQNVVVCRSLREWLERCGTEVLREGCLCHPMDLEQLSNEDGAEYLYWPVVLALRG